MTRFKELFSQPISPRIKNIPRKGITTDFRFTTVSMLILLLLTGSGITLFQLIGMPLTEPEIQGIVLGSAAGALLLILLPNWSMLVFALIAAWSVLYYMSGSLRPLVYAVPPLALIPASMLQILYHWDKAVILRWGVYRTVRGAGLFLLIPFADRISARLDTRIRVTDFSAERTLSRDNVPVHIDAVCFWMIWGPQKAILEVENFVEAVTVSAQTALRDAIGSHELATLLSERDLIGTKLQQILDAKTDPWGITVLSVEFTDIVIPKELENAMSKKAQADREHQARLILGDTEIQLAQKMEEANTYYENNPQAFQLRAMNMVYDGLRQSKGSMVLIPSSAAEQMNLGHPMGMVALQKNQAEKGAQS